MSYSKERDKKNLERINKYLEDMPDFVKDYITYLNTSTTSMTRLEYLKDINFFLNYLKDIFAVNVITSKELNSLTHKDLDYYFNNYLLSYERNGKEYYNTNKSIERKLSAITGFMTYLYNMDVISENVITKVKKPKSPHKEIIYMDQSEIKDFLDIVESGGTLTPKQAQYHKLQSTRDLAICYLMLSTGIRISECVGLDIKDIDFKNSSVHIIRKGGKEAYVYFSDEASGYLMEYIEQRRHIETKEGHEQALFLSSRKSRITDRSVENIVKKYAQRAVPFKNITPHKLRSTFATALYEKTGDLYLVSEDLGHENIQTTKKYADLSNRRKRDNRNVLDFRGFKSNEE